jgi:hypothetical protein
MTNSYDTQRGTPLFPLFLPPFQAEEKEGALGGGPGSYLVTPPPGRARR